MAKNLEKQMDMFEDGGLMDEGGTVDEVSGNDVPPGSLKEEVRDDIPAQLSEGEFVLPADVVRYHGLDKIMALRDEAKAGLARMEAMGQMGNADEATLPDDIPFTLEDLDIEEDEYNYQIGGYVPGQYSGQGYGTYTLPGTGVMQQQPSYLSTYGQQVSQQQPIDYGIYNVPSQQQFRPATYTPEPYTGPRFEDVIPTPTGTYDELRRYVNAQGQVRMIPFVDGKPLYPIPQGFYPQEEAVAEVMPSTTVGQTGVVRERGEGSQREFEAGQTDTASVNASKSNLGITGSRGINLGGLLTGIGFITNPMATLTGMAAKGLMNSLNIETPTLELGSFGKTDPTSFDNLTPEQQAARTRVETITGTPVTGYVGTQVGDIDPVTGGIFGNHGVAVDVDTGFAAVGPNGMSSFNSVDAGKTAMSTSIQSGYYGGLPSFDQFTSLSEQGKKNAATHINALANTLNDTSLLDVNTTMGAINALYGPQQEATSDAIQMAAQQTLKQNVISQLEKTQSFANTASEVEKSTIADVISGFKSPLEAMNEGIDVNSFSSATEAAKHNFGYSSYGEDGDPTGAAPKGSQFSKTGIFSTGDKDTSPSTGGTDTTGETDTGGSPSAGGGSEPDDDAGAPSAPASPGGGGSGPPASEKGNSGNNDGPSNDGPGGTYICTAAYSNGIISHNNFTSLKKYGILLRKNDPYLMKAYDWFGPNIAKYIKNKGAASNAAKWLTSYYNDVYHNKKLSIGQAIFNVVSKKMLRPCYRILGWALIKIGK